MLLYKSVTFPAFRTLSFPAVAPRGAAGRPVHPCSNPDGPRQLPVQWFCYNTESQMAVILGPTPYKMATPRSPVSKSWIDHWSCFFFIFELRIFHCDTFIVRIIIVISTIKHRCVLDKYVNTERPGPTELIVR